MGRRDRGTRTRDELFTIALIELVTVTVALRIALRLALRFALRFAITITIAIAIPLNQPRQLKTRQE